MNRIHKLLILTVSCITLSTQAALPPSARNQIDLEEMVDFAKQHEEIMWTLSNIDLEKKQITYQQANKPCIIQFTREEVDYSDGYVGPAGRLVFHCSTCPLEKTDK